MPPGLLGADFSSQWTVSVFQRNESHAFMVPELPIWLSLEALALPDR